MGADLKPRGIGAALSRLLFAALLVAAAIRPAAGIELIPERAGGRPVLVLQGEMRKGDTERVAAYLGANPGLAEVRFHSPGGKLYEGFGIGLLLRERGLATRVPHGARCVSACVWAFLGGVIRTVDADAAVGVHMATMINDEALIARIRTEIAGQSGDALDVRLRVVMAMTEQAAAQVAAAKAEYIVRMGASLRLLAPGLETESWDVHWLTRAELKDYNVVNVE